MFKRKNVFSDKDSISLLVHTESFLEKIECIEYFVNANKLNSINVYFMPCNLDCESLEIQCGEYIHHYHEGQVFSSIKFSEFSCLTYVQKKHEEMTEHEYSKSLEACILKGNIKDTMFDYVVSDSEFGVEKQREMVIDFSQCKEILRLFLINKDEFPMTENYSVDKTMYYSSYRPRVLFKEFQNYWNAVCETGIISDWDDSLYSRLELISIAIDKCKIEGYTTQDNKAILHLKYHIPYLLLLITGTFDNLAWLINNLYDMKLESDRMKIGILKKLFKDTLKTKSTNLYRIVNSDIVESRIKAIVELRDRVVHRDFIKTIHGRRTGEKESRCYLFIDKPTCDLLMNAGFRKEGFPMETAESNCVDVLEFIDFLENVIVDIVNSVLKTMAKEIYHAENSHSIWKIYQFPKAPYVI